MSNITPELKEILTLLIKELNPDKAFLRKGRVIKSYSAESRYCCDIEVLKNDDSKDDDYPVIAGVEIPAIIGGKNRGIIAPPDVDSLCDIEFYNGDINYPRVSNFRSLNNTPKATIGELIIANSESSFIKIDKNGKITVKSKNIRVECSNADVLADKVFIDSPDIELGGNGGLGLVTQDCPCQFTGSPHAKFTLNVKGK